MKAKSNRNVMRVWLVLMLSCFIAGNAWAGPRGWPYHHHPRSSVQLGVHIGVPLGYPPPVYWPYVYAPPVVPIVVVPQPPVYVEQPRTPLLEPGYWYYCHEAQAYYPYVKQCPGGWQQIAPQPAQ
jgi:hypothetical protein